MIKRYRIKEERIKSFFDFWPLGIMPHTPDTFACAGFFHCGPGDTVQCAWCYGKLLNWNRNSCPLSEHKKFFPNCPKYGILTDQEQVEPTNFENDLFNEAKTFDKRKNFQQLGTSDLGIVTS